MWRRGRKRHVSSGMHETYKASDARGRKGSRNFRQPLATGYHEPVYHTDVSHADVDSTDVHSTDAYQTDAYHTDVYHISYMYTDVSG